MRLAIAALCLSLLVAGCRDFSLASDQDLPPEITRVRTYPADFAGAGAPVEAFVGQSFWLEGKNLTAGDTETPQVTVGGTQARIVSSTDTLVEAQVPSGVASGAQPLRLSTSVGEDEAGASLSVLGTGHLQGRGDTGRAQLLSAPYSAALGPRHAAHVDLSLERLVVTPRDPAYRSRSVMVMGGGKGWFGPAVPIEVAAGPEGMFLRVLSNLGQPNALRSAVVYVETPPPAPEQELPLIVGVPCPPDLSPSDCSEWRYLPASRGGGRMLYSKLLAGAVWLDVKAGLGSTELGIELAVRGAAPPTSTVPLLTADVFSDGYPVAFAAYEPVPGVRPGRLSVVTEAAPATGAKSCKVFDWTWTVAGGQAQLNRVGVWRPLPAVGDCGAADADFDGAGRLVVLLQRGALARELGTGFETLELPVALTDREPARSLASTVDDAVLVTLPRGVARVSGEPALGSKAPGADAGGLAPVSGFLPTAGPPGRIARGQGSATDFLAVLSREELAASPELTLLDGRGPTLLGEASTSFAFWKLAYLESWGQLLTVSPDTLHAVAGNLATGLSAPLLEMTGWVSGFSGWASDGRRLALATTGLGTVFNLPSPAVVLFTFDPAGADAGLSGGIQSKEIKLPGMALEVVLGIATYGEDFVVARRREAQIVSAGGEVRRVPFTSVSVPAEIAPRCDRPGDSCPTTQPFGARSTVLADPVRKVVFLPQGAEAPDLNAPAASAPALAEVSLDGADAGSARWTLMLPDDRLVSDASLSRRGEVLAVVASPIGLRYGKGGGQADVFVTRRGADDAWQRWCRLGRDAVTAVSVSPDGSRLYVGVGAKPGIEGLVGGRVYEVTSLDCPQDTGIIAADPVPYAVLGDPDTAVTAFASSLDGTRLGYVLQGRTATFGFLQ